MSISPYPVKENSKKMQTHKSKPVDSPTVLDSQLTIADIEKALCDCEPHLKNVVSNVQNLLKNNGYVECDQTKSQANDDNYTTRSDFFEIASKIDRKKSPKSEMKKIEFVPITMISDYLKSHEENKNPQSVIEDKINKHLLSCNTRDNSPFQKYSELEMEDVHKAGPSKLADDIPNLKKVDFSNLISRQKIVKGIPKTNSITSHKKIFVSGIDKMPLKNLHRSKRCRTKSPIKTISSISNRKYHSPFLNKRIVKCYDYNNKFCKNTYVNDDDLVERLSQKKVDAFQRAFEETEEKEATEKSLEATKARLNDLSRMRGEKALEKMKIENDYKNLLEELEFLTKRERLIRNRIPVSFHSMHLIPSYFNFQIKIKNQFV